jgi:hypothetical protein
MEGSVDMKPVISAAVLLLAVCAASPEEGRHERLVEHHRALFAELEISEGAVEELCDKVAEIDAAIADHRRDHPEAHAALEGVTRRGRPRSYAEAMGAHRKRFEALGLSDGTSRELEQAFTGVYEDLKGPAPSARAVRIRDLLRQLPPCCDDNIFRRAGALE